MTTRDLDAGARSPLTVLDCTLRDGGFHCAWDFDADQVEAYLRAIDASGVRWAEIGYRSLGHAGFAGAYKFTDEAVVDRLPTLTRARLSVMLDAKEFAGRETQVRELFAPAASSRVELVRIATRPSGLGTTRALVAHLGELGYRTTINLMAWASVPEGDRDEVLRAMLTSGTDVVYIADSYGSMHPGEIREAGRRIAGAMAELGVDVPWGVHLHNNLELAFANALTAIEAGATWIDSSVLGMGRGPGNLKTELLIQHLETRDGLPGYATTPLYELIGRTWEALHERYRWGPRAPYVLSGHLAVHPTYAQELIESGRYTMGEVTAILAALHDSGRGRSFSRPALDEAISARTVAGASAGGEAMPERLSAWRGADWSGREVLVAGRGPSLGRHADAINRYIARHRPMVLECNHLPELHPSDDHLTCFIVRANAERMLPRAVAQGKAALVGLTRPGGIPAEWLMPSVYAEPYRIRGGGLDVAEGELPADVVSMFAIAQAVRHGARRVALVGFDGYEGSVSARDRRMQGELEEFFDLMAAQHPQVEIVSLTPTSFPVETRSVYAAAVGRA